MTTWLNVPLPQTVTDVAGAVAAAAAVPFADQPRPASLRRENPGAEGLRHK